MKHILLFCISIFLGCSLFGQNVQLDAETWYVHEYGANGTLVEPPFTPEMTVQLAFDLGNNVLSGDMCCGGSFQMDVQVDSGTFTFQGLNFTSVPGTCSGTDSNDFADAVAGFFGNNLSDDFSYTATQVDNLVAQLEITNGSGETLLLYNTPHIDKYSMFFPQTWGFDWRVESMSINGSNYDFYNPNQEYGEITASFNYDGSFETTVCGSLTGSFRISEDDGMQNLVLTCENLASNSINCNAAQNNTVQDAYFDFFVNNSGEILQLVHYIIDFQTGPCIKEIFELSNASGDYIIYSNCSSLSIPENKQLSVEVYPNPANQKIYIRNADQSVNEIVLFDMAGKKVQTFKNVKNQIDLSGLSSGTYFFHLRSNKGGTIVKKVIKE